MKTARAAFTHIAIDKIEPGRNVRLDLTGIAALADSLRRHGMLQPITVVPCEGREDAVEVLFGHRRFAAAQLADFDVVPCFMRGRGDERARLLTQIAENFDREDMTPLDEAHAFAELVETGMSQLQIAASVHRSDFYVSTRLTVLKYPDCVQQAVHKGHIGVTAALTIPRELMHDPKNVETLGRILPLCTIGKVTPLRDWIAAKLRAEHREIPHQVRRRRYLEVDLDHYDLAAKAAARAGLTLVEWAHQTIEGAA